MSYYVYQVAPLIPDFTAKNLTKHTNNDFKLNILAE